MLNLYKNSRRQKMFSILYHTSLYKLIMFYMNYIYWCLTNYSWIKKYESILLMSFNWYMQQWNGNEGNFVMISFNIHFDSDFDLEKLNKFWIFSNQNLLTFRIALEIAFYTWFHTLLLVFFIKENSSKFVW